MKDETKKKLSESLKKKWASGTRKPNPQESRRRQAESMKQAYKEGRAKPGIMTSEQAKERVKLRDEELVAEINRKHGKERIGTPNPPGKSGKGVENIHAKYWVLKAPNQQIIKGTNLSEIIRTHAYLFDPKDIEWKGKSKSTCRAHKGLSGLFRMKKDGSGPFVTQWKGWMIGDKMGEEPNA